MFQAALKNNGKDFVKERSHWLRHVRHVGVPICVDAGRVGENTLYQNIASSENVASMIFFCEPPFKRRTFYYRT